MANGNRSWNTNTNGSSVQFPLLATLPIEARNLLAGGLAGIIAKSIVAPLDRIKILYQVSDSTPFRLRDVPRVARSIIEREGPSALWKGNVATMMRVFPYSGIQFMVFDKCKVAFLGERGEESERIRVRRRRRKSAEEEADDSERIRNNNDDRSRAASPTPPSSASLTPIESLVSGMLAGTVSVMCTYPLDMARAQLAVMRKQKKKVAVSSSQSWTKKGLGYVLRSAYQKGGVAGLYRGITPTILGILPYSGMAFTINEQAKRKITQVCHREPTTSERLRCGALSGLFAQSLAYPLEVTRRRMQTIGIVPTSGADSGAVNFAGVLANGSGSVNGAKDLAAAKLPTAKNPLVSSLPPPTMHDTIRSLLETQGIRGFFKGVSMNWIKGPIAFSISFTAFDTVQGWMEEERRRYHLQQLGEGIEVDDCGSEEWLREEVGSEAAWREGQKEEMIRVTVQRRLTSNDD